MIGLLDAAKMAMAVAVAAPLAFVFGNYLGKHEARQEAATAVLEKTVELIQSRERTNAEISSADAASLCAHFELPDAERLECVRRVEQAFSEP